MSEEVQNPEKPHNLEDFTPGQKLEGKITKIDLYGAFIDVGADVEGFLHISRIKRDQVNRIQDIFEVGEIVEVWVQQVDTTSRRIELTMIKPILLKWKDIKPGMSLRGKVIRLEKFGAFVDIDADRPGLIHVSEMSGDYISDPSEVVKVGDEIEVRILDVDQKKKQVRLSMKEQIEEYEDEELEEELPTAMEIALKEAMEETESVVDTPTSNQSPGIEKGRNLQDDILTRTLAQRVQTSTDDNSPV